MARRRRPLQHGSDEGFEVDTREYIDPDAHGSLPAEKRTRLTPVNVRQTAIDYMAAKGAIDHEQKEAADWFRERCELRMMSGGVIDPAKIKVDVSAANSSISEAARIAQLDLNKARDHLGSRDYWLLEQVVEVGRSLSSIAIRLYDTRAGTWLHQKRKEYLGFRVREALTALSDYLRGIGPKFERKRKIQGSRHFTGLSADLGSWNALPDEAKAKA
jgi:hypothetical protein